MADDNSNHPGNGNSSSEDDAKEKDVSRRAFLKNTGIATGGVVGGALLGGLVGNPFNQEESTEKQAIDYTETRQFFKRKEDFNVLSAATERIFPKDDNGPGAIELGVPYFIDKQLAGPWGNNERMYMKRPFQEGETPLVKRDMFLNGLRKINEISRDEYDNAFMDLEAEDQDKILEALQSDDVAINHVSSSVFFETLLQSTLEGAYSDPMYGGNKDMQGWAMKEYMGPRMNLKNEIDEGFEVYQNMERKSLKQND